MKKCMLMIEMLVVTSGSLTGCAASYVKYDIKNSDPICLPVVRADAALGVYIEINNIAQCSKNKKAKAVKKETARTLKAKQGKSQHNA